MVGRKALAAGGVVLALLAFGGGAYVLADGIARDSLESTASAAIENELSDRLGIKADVSVNIGSGRVLPGLGSGTLKDVDADVSFSYDTLLRQVQNYGLTQVTSVTGSGDTLKLTGAFDLMGASVPVTASVQLVPSGTHVSARLVSVQALGRQVSVASLPAVVRDKIAAWQLPIPDLPDGIEIASIDAGQSDVTVYLHADAIDIDTLRDY